VIAAPEGLGGAPGVVGVGIDVVEVRRMARALERTTGFADRCFTDAEQATCRRHHDAAASFAARFAAKEAVLKALGLGIFAVPLVDIEVVGGAGTAPSVVLSGAAASAAAAAGAARWLVSLTHDGGVAAAVVVAIAT
jgi:holo-[acyl-carrier protein] synthase